jgi:Uma2 family endonuclease
MSELAFRSEDLFTQKQFRRWVDKRPLRDVNRYELLEGRIVMTPPAGWSHGTIESKIAELIGAYVRRRRLGITLGSSAGFDLPSGDTVEPDFSYVSAARLAERPTSRPDQFLRAVPDLVVEILSPTTAKRDRIERKQIYERNGIDEYWIVDSRAKTVEVFSLGERGYGAAQTFGSGYIRSKVLPGLRVGVEKLFAIAV